jgi:WhiB family redox-sensing transcriptional regulator
MSEGHGGSVALPLHVEPNAIEDDEWRDVAACRDTNPDLFFPVGTTGPAIEQIEEAKAVCRQCPALAPCLEFALMTNQDSGVWGGTSEEERRKLRKAWLAARRSQRAAF